MNRVYGNVDDATLHLIDDQARTANLNRSSWVSAAIMAYLHLSDAEAKNQEIQQQLTERAQHIAHLEELLKVRESEIQHLRSMTNDLRSLADTMASKIPALPPGPEEIKEKGKWWKFW
jgi:cell division protein ZapA (FtsZ GTPase activity inhibitor)